MVYRDEAGAISSAALQTRFEVYQSQGMVMTSSASARLRRWPAYAYSRERRIGELSDDIVSCTLPLRSMAGGSAASLVGRPGRCTQAVHSIKGVGIHGVIPGAAEVLVEVADTLVEEFDLIECLQMVTSRTADLADTSAVGLLLADRHGRLQLMAASDERAKMLELFQVQAEEGPCQDCSIRVSPYPQPIHGYAFARVGAETSPVRVSATTG